MKPERVHGDPTRNYGKEWRRWRKAYRLSQRDLAQALGLTVRTVLNIEKGYHRPNMSSRQKMNELQRRYEEAKA